MASSPSSTNPFSASPEESSLSHASGSDTLASYVTDYKIENNRRYHSYRAGSYWGPNDEAASEGQDLAHAIYNLTLGALHLAPLADPKQILDVGTGTGIWAIEMADDYPEAQITGIDLSPIQPELVPINCMFEVDDANMEWTWEDDFFDFVHVREMFGSIANWDSFAREALRCTKPGGYFEIVEHSASAISDDDTIGEDSIFTTWGRTIESLGRSWGKTFNVWSQSRSIMERAGFVDVVERRYKWPLNEWPDDPQLKQIGRLNKIRLLENIEAFTMRLFTGTGNWTLEEAHLFLAQVRVAIKDTNIHGYHVVTVVHGRKPS